MSSITETAELEVITDAYFRADNGKAEDIYTQESFLVNYIIKQHKGLWERPPGGDRIEIPLEYDRANGGWYSKGEAISSDDKQMIDKAYAEWKHLYENATVSRIDELKNNSEYAKVRLVEQRVAAAQKAVGLDLAGAIYAERGASSKQFTGFGACCDTTTTAAFENLTEAAVVSEDGTYPWKGVRDTTAEGITYTVLIDLVASAHFRAGPGGEPDLVATTLSLFNVLKSVLQPQQMFTKSDKTTQVGFQGLRIDNFDFFPDDFCPSGWAVAITSKHFGAAIHSQGYMKRTEWYVIPNSAMDRTMKIFCDGNYIWSNRRVHAIHTNLT